jgi:Fe2+ transport system protein FeoA
MHSVRVVSTSKGRAGPGRPGVRRVHADRPAHKLSSLPSGARGVVVDVVASTDGRTDRLLALGVTPGAIVVVLQTFPGIVFLCDQTELAVERGVADAILVRRREDPS